MLASQIPTYIPTPFADSAGAGFIRTVPIPSQIGITPGAASFTTGFPPLNFSPVNAGGVPPFGQDFNGLLNQITAWSRWAQAGGLVGYNSAFSTAIGGYPQGAVLVKADGSGFWLSTADNNTSNPDTGGANWTAMVGTQAYSRVIGANSANNSGSPNSQIDLNATAIEFWNPTTGVVTLKRSPGVVTNDISLSNASANGRDQSGAFSVSSFVHLYHVLKNDGTVVSRSSVSDQTVGPTLQTNEIAWAYAAPWRIDGSGNLLQMRLKGAWQSYKAQQVVLTNGSATTETAISLSTFVPTNTLETRLNVQGFGGTTDGSGNINTTAVLRVVASLDFSYSSIVLTGLGASQVTQLGAGGDVTVPNIVQQVLYLNVVTTGSSPQFTVNVRAIKVPNGGE